MKNIYLSYSNKRNYTASSRGGGHEREISNAGRLKLDFTEIDQCKPVLLGLSLAKNLVKSLLSLYRTEWRERGYGLRGERGEHEHECVKKTTLVFASRWKSH
jgi:hypothetical protein